VPVVMQIIGPVHGAPTSFDGQYIIEYDPSQQGFSPDGSPMLCLLRTTPDISEATHYTDIMAALCVYQQFDGVRSDGKPNRPLTFFHVEFRSVSSDGDGSQATSER